MPLTTFDRLLWVLCFTGHCGLLTVLFSRRRAALFPLFTTLIAANVLKTAVLYLTLRQGSSEVYFYVYWTLAILDTILQLAVAYELATHVFQPLGAWAPDVRRSFSLLLGVSLIIALGLTLLAAPPTRTLRLAIVIRGIFLLRSDQRDIRRDDRTFGHVGFCHGGPMSPGSPKAWAFTLLFGILTDAAHTYFESDWSKDTYKALSHIQIALYLACLAYWIVTLNMKEPEPLKLPEQLHEELRALQRRAALMLQSLRTIGSAS